MGINLNTINQFEKFFEAFYSKKPLSEFYKAPEKSGIYYLIYKNEVVYIGQSNNLKNRMTQHIKFGSNLKNWIKRIENDKEKQITSYKTLAMYYLMKEEWREWDFTYTLVDTKDLNKLEEIAIEYHQPRFNTEGVDKPYRPYIREER